MALILLAIFKALRSWDPNVCRGPPPPPMGQSLVPPKAKTKSEQSYRAAALSKHAQKSSLCNRGTRLAQIANAQRPGSNAWAGLLSASSFLEKMLVMIRQHKDIAP